MVQLPPYDDVQLPLEKLTGWALSGDKTNGKAELFRLVFGFGPDDAEHLRELLLDGLDTGAVTGTRHTKWGQRFQVEIPVCGHNDRTANVETIWQSEAGGVLRLITIRSVKPGKRG